MKKYIYIVLCLLCLLQSITFSVSVRKIKSLGFDKTNFSKSSISLEDVFSGGPSKDGIPSIDKPKFVALKFSVLNQYKTEPVIVIDYKNVVKAYPIRLLMWHEIVNDKINQESIVITFCPLCNAGIVYDTNFNGKNHRFGVSGLLRNSDMIFYDDETETLWQQFTGIGLVGDYKDKSLKHIPSMLMSFESLLKKYPQAQILSSKTGFNRRYGKNPYAMYDEGNTYFPTFPINSRKNKLGRLLGILLDGKAYHFALNDLNKFRNKKIEIDGKILKVRVHGKHNAALNKASIRQSKLINSVSVYQINKLTKKEELLVSSTFFRFAWLGFYPNSKKLNK
ncbi:MAG: hypothetical protein COB02_01495 [Candidatus Cloacimonadota bacterium]|nr:MAG: hypothetical protein COB02_01495 [Candidatus Cloacimonadota bacterium]